VRDHDHEADDARWFPIEQAIKQLKFATERKMVHRAWSMLTARQRQQRPRPVRKAIRERQKDIFNPLI